MSYCLLLIPALFCAGLRTEQIQIQMTADGNTNLQTAVLQNGPMVFHRHVLLPNR